MTTIKKLKNGSLLVPKRIEGDGFIGDAFVEIKPDSNEYQKFLKEYEREQSLGFKEVESIDEEEQETEN